MIKPGRELDLMVADAMGLTPLETFCSGEIEFHSDGRWYCQKCGFYCDEPGNIDFIHAERPKWYSTHWEDAGEAWEWLQKEVENNPPKGWKQVDGQVYLLALADYDGPAVMLIQDTDFGIPLYWEREPEYPYNWYIPGETYQHAIALAVVEAAKAKVPDKAA